MYYENNAYCLKPYPFSSNIERFTKAFLYYVEIFFRSKRISLLQFIALYNLNISCSSAIYVEGAVKSVFKHFPREDPFFEAVFAR